MTDKEEPHHCEEENLANGTYTTRFVSKPEQVTSIALMKKAAGYDKKK